MKTTSSSRPEAGRGAATSIEEAPGSAEPGAFRDALGAVWRAVAAAGGFSFFANILMLAGPIYMLQVYDRVLASRSVPTLAALTVLLVALYAALGLLEAMRGQIMNRVAGRIDRMLGPATLEMIPRYRLETGARVADEPLRDLATLRQFLSGPGPAAFFDLPWTPVFVLAIYLVHPSLGLLTVIGGALMTLLALFNELSTRRPMREAKRASEAATRMALESGRNMEAALAMGMMDPVVARWKAAQDRADLAFRRAGDRIAAFSSATRILRLLMQSLLLGAGALLAIGEAITPGMMIAVSIIGGRALGPIGQAVAQWRGLVGARESFARLRSFHRRYPAEARRASLPAPVGRLEARGVTAAPPGVETPVLKEVSFEIDGGESLGVIGPSAAGKSTLARVMVGLWRPQDGAVRLDGAALTLWDRADLGRQIGYLPQSVELFNGTVAENISRLYPDATWEAVYRAADLVGAHEMILGLPGGYEFPVGEGGARLSSGQRQRIGLARAVFGDPLVVVLDEPNAHLDTPGEAALARAVAALKEAGATVVLITHRPSGLELVDRILVLEQGRVRAFGPKTEVLATLRGALKPPPARGPAVATPVKRPPKPPFRGA